jgi:protein-S-isoprenylcysteine O-methyltransferase Ste14
MNDTEFVYRATVAVLGITGFGIRFYFQWQLRRVQRIARRSAGRDQVFYWLVFSAYVLAFVYAFSGLLDFAHFDLPPAVRWLGLPAGLLSLWLLVSAHRALGRNWSGILEISEQHRLVVTGPYNRVRHPMYSAFFCLAASYALLSANWLIAASNLGAVTLMYLARVRDEERMMLEQFGEEYRVYMARTGRLIPPLLLRHR